MKKKLLLVMVGVITLTLVGGSAWSAMQIRKRPKPAAEEGGAKAPPGAATKPKAPAKPPTEIKPGKAAAPIKKAAPRRGSTSSSKKKRKRVDTTSFSGSVDYVRGRKVLVKLDKATKLDSRFNVYDIRLRKRGSLKVVKVLSQELYLCKLLRGSADEGDWLAKETERGAYTRIKHTKSLRAYKEFLTVFPASKFKDRVARMVFRQLLRTKYPAAPGSVINGKIVLAEKVGQEVVLSRAKIKLDRFIISMTDEAGNFYIEGIPQLDHAIKVSLSIYDEKFKMAKKVEIALPAGSTSELDQTLTINLTPTYLVGRVVDDNGNPVRGAQVWTSPYTMEKITDEKGEFKIWRKKKLDASGEPTEGDEPLMGRDYEIYAYKKGYGAEKTTLSAKSFTENAVGDIAVSRQDPVSEGLPELAVNFRDNLDLMQFVFSAGAGPKINR